MNSESADWTVRTRRDVGAGFKRDEELSLGNWPSDWKESEPAIRVSQLGGLVGDVADTAPYPLIHADFLQSRNRWLIVSRGRGGLFGAAGTVQELLAPAGWGLASSWAHALAARRPDGLLDMRHPVSPSPVRADAMDCEACLSAMELGEVAAVVLCPPERMAKAISLIARMVPEALVRDFIWGTWIEKRFARSKTISAEWPAPLQLAWPDTYRMTLRGRRTIDPAATPHLSKELYWVLGEALAGRFVANDSGATSFTAWLAELKDLVPWTIMEAEAALMSGDTKELDWRLTDQPELARELVRRFPKRSMQLVTEVASPQPLIRAFEAEPEARPLLVGALLQEACGSERDVAHRLSLVVADTSPAVIRTVAQTLAELDWESIAEAQNRRAWATHLTSQSTNRTPLSDALRKATPPDYDRVRSEFEVGHVTSAVDAIRYTNNPLRHLSLALEKTRISPERFVALALALKDGTPPDGGASLLQQVHTVVRSVDRRPREWAQAVIEHPDLTGLEDDSRFSLVDSVLRWLGSQGHARTAKLDAAVVALLFPVAAKPAQQQPVQAKEAKRAWLGEPSIFDRKRRIRLIVSIAILVLVVVIVIAILAFVGGVPWQPREP